MSHAPLTPDDPRLTAYVLGELDEADRAAVDAALAADPACRQAVDELRQTSAVLFEALQSEPAPVLSEAQRESIRTAARPRLVRLPEPTANRRQGIVPLLAATIACAALLVGVSAWNFERPARQTAARDDNAQDQSRMLAFKDTVDGLGVVDESTPEDLRRLARMDDLAVTAGRDPDPEKNFAVGSRESEELRQTIIASDGETPNVTMNIEQAELLQLGVTQLRDRAPVLTGEQFQGLANTTTRPSVPGNMGSVVDPSVDFMQRSFSAGGRSARTSGATSSLETLAPTRGRESTSGVTDRAENEAKPVLRQYRQPTVEYQQRLGRQAGLSGQGEGQPATRHYFRAENRSGSQTPQQAHNPFADPLTSPGAPAAQPSAAGMPGQPAESVDGLAASPEEPESDRVYPLGDLVTGAPRGEALRENLAGSDNNANGVRVGQVDPQTFERNLDIPFRQGSFELGVPEFESAGGRRSDWDGNLNITLGMDAGGQAQFVPLFALSDLQRLSEPASGQDGAGIAAGDNINFNGVPPVVSNSATIEQDLFLGAQPLVESEQRGLQEQGQAVAGLDFGRTPVTWEDGSWYAVVRGGRKLRLRHVPGTEEYAPIHENRFLSPLDQPLSTFGLDVDTASYANVRRFLMDERRFPPPDAVRIEEMINYFAYSDPQPAGGEPVGVSLEASSCPWNSEHRLVRIGVKAREIDLAERPPTTLVFLIDTSGSMRDDNKLPLVKDSLRVLVNEMTENDRIAIVTYNTDAGLLLDSTSGEQRHEILAAIEGLQAGGSTNGEAGLKLAYRIAGKHFIRHGQNRVICCTDGDFNVGTSATDPLVKMIADKRDSGVFLSICGYGTGNIKDEKLERIADTGNGQYHYVDNLKEARKVFLDELTGTLYTVAKDVKLQVEFNPARVASYRLIGYENRTLAAEDFNNDRVDSGDMGAGHSVTALYEVVPVGVKPAKPARETPGVDPLKYQGTGGRGQGTGDRGQEAGDSEQPSEDADPLAATHRGAPGNAATSGVRGQGTGDADDREAAVAQSAEWLTVKLRYKQPDGDESVKREYPLVIEQGGNEPDSIDLQWSAAVASFGMLLRSSRHAGGSSLDGVLEMAQSAKGRDESGRRREFIDMVLQTRSLVRRLHGSPIPTPRELSSTDARQKATVGGKYEELLDKFEARDDAERYGEFHEYGWSADKSHAGRSGLPAGYWVYVYPDWYIWGETVSTRE